MARVRYFAAAEEFAGRAEEHRVEPDVATLRRALTAEYPALGRILTRCAVLVGGRRVGDDTVLAIDATVDVPVSYTHLTLPTIYSV